MARAHAATVESTRRLRIVIYRMPAYAREQSGELRRGRPATLANKLASYGEAGPLRSRTKWRATARQARYAREQSGELRRGRLLRCGGCVQQPAELALGCLVGGATGFAGRFDADRLSKLAVAVDELDHRRLPSGRVRLGQNPVPAAVDVDRSQKTLLQKCALVQVFVCHSSTGQRRAQKAL